VLTCARQAERVGWEEATEPMYSVMVRVGAITTGIDLWRVGIVFVACVGGVVVVVVVGSGCSVSGE